MYEIDPTDVENSIEKAMLTLQKSQFTHEQNVEAYNNQNVASPISGLVTNLYVKEGDTVGNNGKIADVVDTSELILRVPFNVADIPNLSVGDEADVKLASSFTSLTGRVTRISTGERVLDGYITVKDVEITIQNPGALSDADVASASIGGADCAEPATLSYAAVKTILAKTSGEVKSVYLFAGDKVSAGEAIARVENESAALNMDTSALNVQDAELALQNLYDQQKEYNITSPISGKVIQKNYKAGDTVDNTSSSVILAIVADMSQFVFTLNVDELDISKIKLGQEVKVTADALPNQTFTGTVDNISVVGQSASGVATYPVKVKMEAKEGLLPGMNISAEIVVEESKDTLMVPIDAVNRGNIVYVKDDGTDRSADMPGAGRSQNQQNSQQQSGGQPSQGSAQQDQNNQSGGASSARGGNLRLNAPEGYVAVVVTTGVNDDNYIEIKKGLKEGDTVIVTAKAQSSNTNIQIQQGGMVAVTGGGPPPSGGGNFGGGTRVRVGG